jgi:Calcium binding
MLVLNDRVTVIPGTKDPDFENASIGGWQGRIKEIDTGNPDDVLILIEWDANTLQNMPKNYVRKCIIEGYDYETMWLGCSDVTLIEDLGISQDRNTILEAPENTFGWVEFGQQGQRIQAVEDSCTDDFALMDHWFEYLETQTELPLIVKYIGDNNLNLHNGAILQIIGFADADDNYGVIGAGIYNKRQIQVSLCDVEVLESSSGSQALEDYIVWFVNR